MNRTTSKLEAKHGERNIDREEGNREEEREGGDMR